MLTLHIANDKTKSKEQHTYLPFVCLSESLKIKAVSRWIARVTAKLLSKCVILMFSFELMPGYHLLISRAVPFTFSLVQPDDEKVNSTVTLNQTCQEFLKCISEKGQQHASCRSITKEYLTCRMNKFVQSCGLGHEDYICTFFMVSWVVWCSSWE